MLFERATGEVFMRVTVFGAMYAPLSPAAAGRTWRGEANREFGPSRNRQPKGAVADHATRDAATGNVTTAEVTGDWNC